MLLKGKWPLNKLDLINKKGFTLIEIIAVLLIIGIISAVAAKKYLSLTNQARTLAAQGAIAEIKGRLSSAQSKYIMVNRGIAPTSPQLYTYATGNNAYRNAANLNNVGTDFNVRVTSGTPNITITVNRVLNVNLAPNVVGRFRAAGS